VCVCVHVSDVCVYVHVYGICVCVYIRVCVCVFSMCLVPSVLFVR